MSSGEHGTDGLSLTAEEIRADRKLNRRAAYATLSGPVISVLGILVALFILVVVLVFEIPTPQGVAWQAEERRLDVQQTQLLTDILKALEDRPLASE